MRVAYTSTIKMIQSSKSQLWSQKANYDLRKKSQRSKNPLSLKLFKILTPWHSAHKIRPISRIDLLDRFSNIKTKYLYHSKYHRNCPLKSQIINFTPQNPYTPFTKPPRHPTNLKFRRHTRWFPTFSLFDCYVNPNFTKIPPQATTWFFVYDLFQKSSLSHPHY